MAEGLSGQHPPVRTTDEHAVEAPAGRRVAAAPERVKARRSFPQSGKFRAATATLIGLAVGALAVAAVLLATHSKSAPSAPWSSWQPPDSGTLGASEIAGHVAPLYRISGTDQLAVVTVVNLANANAAAAAAETGTTTPSSSSGLQVAVRPDTSSSAVSLLTGNTIAYNLCGIGGSNCAIGAGQASTARLLLLRREALELALYTFKYIGGTQNVVAILPPGHTVVGCTGICSKPNQRTTTQSVTIALLFLRDELQPWLSQPLAATLPEEFPPTVSQITQAPEASLVEQVTARGMFEEKVEQAQDGSNLLVLSPLPAQ